MNKLFIWIRAARLRTLPLSFSGIIVGTAMAATQGKFDEQIFVLALATTLIFQILSNFANDYGDGVKGTDNSNRIGPKRVLQSGELSPKNLLFGIILLFIVGLLFVGLTIKTAFANHTFYLGLFAGFGILALLAAIFYTMGKFAYGYYGLGDVFVFVFFGALSVMGSYFLFTKTWTPLLILPTISIGTLAVAVLNLNNMRDVENDTNSNKRTLVVRWGVSKAIFYHQLLLIGSFLAFLLFLFFSESINLKRLLPLVAFIPLFIHYKRILIIRDPIHFDPELKKVALSTFLFSVLFALSLLI